MGTAADAPRVETKADLAAYLESGCKPKAQWRVGTEHEKFGYLTDSFAPLPYDGPRSVRAVLDGLAERFGWTRVLEGGNVIALLKDGASVSLEPGGQVELSGAPLEHIHQTCNEVHAHLEQVKAVCEPLGVAFFGMGFTPIWTRDQMPRMPKARYGIMRSYMPKRGNLGLDMMHRTATVQVNLDFESEACMRQKFRASLALQPIATALFANSGVTEGKPNGWCSFRGKIWTDTDPDRTGLLSFVFDDGFGFERYVDYMLDVPMYFVMREGRYIDASGQSFRAFMDGELPALPGERPTLEDWKDHLSTAFPEVRLKTFLEMRGADGGPWARLCALPAFWTGILYDDDAIAAAWDIAKHWSTEQREHLRIDAARTGLQAKIAGRTVQEIARELVEISAAGLKRRHKLGAGGDDETGFLDVLREIARSGRTMAEVAVERLESEWGGDARKLVAAETY